MRKLLTTVALATTLTLTGCLGPNNASNGLRNWNAELSDTDAIDEIVFLAMTIIPVYGIVGWADVVIFNTIDYWSGDNPIGDPGEFPHEAFGSK